MKLYFNGCSHTRGKDLVNPDLHSWPSLIANTLDCEFFNDSINGGANDRIMYQTIKNINFFDKFYIAWTHTARFTRYRSDNNHGVNFNPQLTNNRYENNPEFKKYGQLHYAYWHNELYNFKIWLQNIILLQKFFESKKKTYVMINASNNLINQWSVSWKEFNLNTKSLLCFSTMNDDQLFAEHNEIQQLLGQINYQYFLGWNTWWITKLIDYYPVGPTKHLLEQGHQAVADYILKYNSN